MHYIALSTELWYGVMDQKLGNTTLDAELKWLEQDLIKADSNRANVPWSEAL